MSSPIMENVITTNTQSEVIRKQLSASDTHALDKQFGQSSFSEFANPSASHDFSRPLVAVTYATPHEQLNALHDNLQSSQSVFLSNIDKAKQYFGLSSEQMEQLPAEVLTSPDFIEASTTLYDDYNDLVTRYNLGVDYAITTIESSQDISNSEKQDLFLQSRQVFDDVKSSTSDILGRDGALIDAGSKGSISSADHFDFSCGLSAAKFDVALGGTQSSVANTRDSTSAPTMD